MQSLTWTTELIPGPLSNYCGRDVDNGEAPLDTGSGSASQLLGEALPDTEFTTRPTAGTDVTSEVPFDAPFFPSHCRVLSSEPLNGTDTVLSVLTIEGGMLQQSLNFTCTGNESSSTDVVQLLVTGESCSINYS